LDNHRGCGDTAALLGSALSEIGSKSSLIGISSYGSSGLTNRSDVQSLESPVEIYIDRHEHTQTKPSNESSNTPLDLHHPFHISVGGSRSQNGDEWSFRRTLQNEVCKWLSQEKHGPCAAVSLVLGGDEDSALHVCEAIRARQHILILQNTRQMAAVSLVCRQFLLQKKQKLDGLFGSIIAASRQERVINSYFY